VFRREPGQTQRAAGFFERQQRRIAFTHGDEVARFHLRQELSESPHAARIPGQRRTFALSPYFLESERELARRASPRRIDNLQQVSALSAAERCARIFLYGAALHATQRVSHDRRIDDRRSHRRLETEAWVGRRQTGTAKSALAKNSSWTARTTSAAADAATAKQMLSSLAPWATAITLT
jgi:hypothetical protein